MIPCYALTFSLPIRRRELATQAPVLLSPYSAWINQLGLTNSHAVTATFFFTTCHAFSLSRPLSYF